ncbi:NitT/TauT family transport system permease protein [Desulfohalotomaculum tongense]|uniref:ABC transporter permease n=1 Tax=Desulforadius tongensis TaxID=1216062 RepID=UPI00195B4EC4|nr:ABC transporter permease [Desulforadius tongensis]MBM7855955.1 NitT/TauT family transport system permease protein [Desulforadius tongensis]
MKNSTWLSRGTPLLGLLFLLIAWQLLANLYNPVIVPSPAETARALTDLLITGRMWEHAGTTIARGLMGFAMSVIIGTPVGLLMGLNPVIRRLLQPHVVTIQVTPIISWLVLAMIWFGFDKVPVFVVFITTVPLVIINIIQGIENIDPQLVEMAKTFQVDKKSLLMEVYIPQITPYLFAAMSVALGTTWKAVAMAEFLSTSIGIGAGMHQAKINLETAEVFAWTFLLIILGLTTDRGLQYINRRLSGWRED